MRTQVFSILVNNHPGVLSRIAGLFNRRGYSVDSITAGTTADPRFTRITIVSTGDELVLQQIEKQMAKLEDVRHIKLLNEGEAVLRELIMVKLSVSPQERAEVISIANIFKAKIVDVDFDCLMIELTGNQNKLQTFMDLVSQYKVLELARTGVTALSRGSSDVVDLD